MNKCTGVFFNFFLLLLFVNAKAQKEKDLFKIQQTYVVNLANVDSSVRAEVYYDQKEIKTNINYTYYWYYINKINCTKGDYDGRLLHGTYTCYYPNSNMRQRGEFKNGLRNGVWHNWSPDGKLREESNWKNSKKNGKTKLFGVNGELISVMNFKDDKLSGNFINYDKDGNVVSKRKYRNNKEVQKMQVNPISLPRRTKKVKQKEAEPNVPSTAPNQNSGSTQNSSSNPMPAADQNKEESKKKGRRWIKPLKKKNDQPKEEVKQ